MASWLDPALSLPRQLEVEAARRQIPSMPRAELEGRLSAVLAAWMMQDQMLRQALGRVCELEATLAAMTPAPPPPRRGWWGWFRR